MGALETLMYPSSGRFISRTREIAADIELDEILRFLAQTKVVIIPTTTADERMRLTKSIV